MLAFCRNRPNNLIDTDGRDINDPNYWWQVFQTALWEHENWAIPAAGYLGAAAQFMKSLSAWGMAEEALSATGSAVFNLGYGMGAGNVALQAARMTMSTGARGLVIAWGTGEAGTAGFMTIGAGVTVGLASMSAVGGWVLGRIAGENISWGGKTWDDHLTDWMYNAFYSHPDE